MLVTFGDGTRTERMYFVYSLLLSLGFLLMSPLFLLRREKYASGFSQRLGNYTAFEHDDRKVIWLHCVSVGETNAARPLVASLRTEFPDHRLVISTTTKTGQELARKLFADLADAIVYFPFDFKFSVRRALSHFKPSLVLLMETEIWPRFIHEAKLFGAKVAIVNGRLSQKSFERYSVVRAFVNNVLADVDLASMQDEESARRLIALGMDARATAIVGNMKYEVERDGGEKNLTEYFRHRFGFSTQHYLIVAASTHSPEESLILKAVGQVNASLATKARVMIAPRHPERFDALAQMLTKTTLKTSRRSDDPSEEDLVAEVILLDSIGELRSVFPLAHLVFVGGSLIPHGGQNILEPADAGRAIVTGPHTFNFSAVVSNFLASKALLQLPDTQDEDETVARLASSIEGLLLDPVEREFLGRNARSMIDLNRGATEYTIQHLRTLLSEITDR